jgi:hypothetical protein
MGGIWEDRSDVNRGVPCRTALYGAGATCRFSVSGGRGLARAALGVKGSQVRILSSRRPSLQVREGAILADVTLSDVVSDYLRDYGSSLPQEDSISSP